MLGSWLPLVTRTSRRFSIHIHLSSIPSQMYVRMADYSLLHPLCRRNGIVWSMLASKHGQLSSIYISCFTRSVNTWPPWTTSQVKVEDTSEQTIQGCATLTSPLCLGMQIQRHIQWRHEKYELLGTSVIQSGILAHETVSTITSSLVQIQSTFSPEQVLAGMPWQRKQWQPHLWPQLSVLCSPLVWHV